MAIANERPTPWIVNVGLPRTGTHSFARAVEMLGLRSLHIWGQAEFNPEVLARFRANDPELRAFLAQYHAVCDTPFYALRDTFEKYYPDTLIVYTTRLKQDWVRSMLNHRMAGGDFLAQLYGLRGIPYRETDAAALGELYDKHHADVCQGLAGIDLADPDSHSKWELLCSALPNYEETITHSRQLAWPHENRSVNVSAQSRV